MINSIRLVVIGLHALIVLVPTVSAFIVVFLALLGYFFVVQFGAPDLSNPPQVLVNSLDAGYGLLADDSVVNASVFLIVQTCALGLIVSLMNEVVGRGAMQAQGKAVISADLEEAKSALDLFAKAIGELKAAYSGREGDTPVANLKCVGDDRTIRELIGYANEKLRALHSACETQKGIFLILKTDVGSLQSLSDLCESIAGQLSTASSRHTLANLLTQLNGFEEKHTQLRNFKLQLG